MTCATSFRPVFLAVAVAVLWFSVEATNPSASVIFICDGVCIQAPSASAPATFDLAFAESTVYKQLGNALGTVMPALQNAATVTEATLVTAIGSLASEGNVGAMVAPCSNYHRALYVNIAIKLRLRLVFLDYDATCVVIAASLPAALSYAVVGFRHDLVGYVIGFAAGAQIKALRGSRGGVVAGLLKSRTLATAALRAGFYAGVNASCPTCTALSRHCDAVECHAAFFAATTPHVAVTVGIDASRAVHSAILGGALAPIVMSVGASLAMEAAFPLFENRLGPYVLNVEALSTSAPTIIDALTAPAMTVAVVDNPSLCQCDAQSLATSTTCCAIFNTSLQAGPGAARALILKTVAYASSEFDALTGFLFSEGFAAKQPFPDPSGFSLILPQGLRPAVLVSPAVIGTPDNRALLLQAAPPYLFTFDFLSNVLDEESLLNAQDFLSSTSAIANVGGVTFLHGGLQAGFEGLGAVSQAVLQDSLRRLFQFPNGSFAVVPVGTSNAGPSARMRHSAAVNGTDVIFSGGLCAYGATCTDMWILDTVALAWRKVDSVNPNAKLSNLLRRHAHSSVYLPGARRLLLVGGRTTATVLDPLLVDLSTGQLTDVPSVAGIESINPCLIPTASNQVLLFATDLKNVPVTEALNVFSFKVGVLPNNALLTVNTTPQPRSCGLVRQAGMLSVALVVASGALGDSDGLALQWHRAATCDGHNNFVPNPSGTACDACLDSTVALDGWCQLCDASRESEFCPTSYDAAPVVLGFFIVIFLQIAVMPMVYALVRSREELQKLEENERAATELAEAVAEMQFERVNFLESLKNPTRLQRALARCRRTLMKYRAILPPAVLSLADAAAASAYEEEAQLQLAVGAGLLSSRTSIVSNGSALGAGHMSERHYQSPEMRSLQAGPSQSKYRSNHSGLGAMSGHSSIDATSGIAIYRPAANRMRVASRVLKALDSNTTASKVAVVVTNVVGFHRWQQSFKKPESFVKKYCHYSDTVLQLIQQKNGIPEVVLGDKIIASWNGARPCGDYIATACDAAFAIKSNRTLEGYGLRVQCGVSAGPAVVGIVGDHEKRHTVITPAIGEAFALCRLCTKLSCEIMVPFSFAEPLDGRYILRIVGLGRFGAQLAPAQPPPPPAGEAPPPTTPKHPAQQQSKDSMRMIAELVAPRNDPMWLYEVKGLREHLDTYNTLMQLVNLRRLDDARMVPLTSMPRWHASELRHVLEAGELDVEDLTVHW